MPCEHEVEDCRAHGCVVLSQVLMAAQWSLFALDPVLGCPQDKDKEKIGYAEASRSSVHYPSYIWNVWLAASVLRVERKTVPCWPFWTSFGSQSPDRVVCSWSHSCLFSQSGCFVRPDASWGNLVCGCSLQTSTGLDSTSIPSPLCKISPGTTEEHSNKACAGSSPAQTRDSPPCLCPCRNWEEQRGRCWGVTVGCTTWNSGHVKTYRDYCT